MILRGGFSLFAVLVAATLALPRSAFADVFVAEPVTPIVATFPSDAPAVEAQVVLQLVIDSQGGVESAVVVSRAPANAGAAFDAAALEAVRAARFHASTRDGRPFRSRIEYVVVFHPPRVMATEAGTEPRVSEFLPPASPSPVGPAPNEPPIDTPREVEVRGVGWASPRGIGDSRIERDLLQASPRQQTSEMLSAAPGFFVDHEDSEGFGNDVYLRGFDLDHGSGIEMRVGNVPINSPVHVHGQGYADANFIIPEVVRSVRVLEGPYDPRQGDAAIVGSAYFDLAVPQRGTTLKASYGSWNQMRLVGISAPRGANEETFAAFSARKTDGFGPRRSSRAGSVNLQYGFALSERDHVTLLTTAYAARSKLPGVVREDDVETGAMSVYDAYPYFSAGQGIQASRVIASATFSRTEASGARIEVAPWFMWTDFRARENFTGNIYSSALDPALAGGQGDLWETFNQESALGVVARFHFAPLRIAPWLEATAEPGVYVRSGHTTQSKSLLNPDTRSVWDRRLNAELDTLDAGAYLDVDVRAFRRLRLSGGIRGDFLAVSVSDRLAYDLPANAGAAGIPGALRSTLGVPISPRVTAEYEVVPELSLAASYGEGFRSLGANATVATSDGIAGAGPTLREGAKPYSKIRSVEAGARARTRADRFSAAVSLFESRVENELVFEASSGGFSTQGASVRRGLVASSLVKPFAWLLGSASMSVASSTFTTLVPGVSHYVPNVPPLLFRADVTARGELGSLRGVPVNARVGVGYTFLAGRHLTDKIVGPSNHVLNAGVAVRRGIVELGLDGYNLLALQYADQAEYYVSNWSLHPGTALATPAIHLTQAPPLSLVASLSIYL